MTTRTKRGPRLEHGRFYFGTTKADRYTMPDPRDASLVVAKWTARYLPGKLTRLQVALLLASADAYWHLAAHPAGTESVIKQLRELRRAVKVARRAAAECQEKRERER